jgi:hypothetical protein
MQKRHIFFGNENRRRIACTLSAAALIVLSGCQKKTADLDKDGEVSSEERVIAKGLSDIAPMKPGLWNIDVRFDAMDVPSLSGKKAKEIAEKMSKAASSRQCLSTAEAKNPPAMFYGGVGSKNCRYRSVSATDGKVTIALSCVKQNMATVDTELNGTTTDSAFDFGVTSALRLPVIGKVDLRGTAVGRYVGECGVK